eukprot:12928095-Prorocentrum_lima.AAC.1
MLIGQRTRWIDQGKKDGRIQIDQEKRIEELGEVAFDNSLKDTVTCDSDHTHPIPERARPEKLAAISNA